MRFDFAGLSVLSYTINSRITTRKEIGFCSSARAPLHYCPPQPQYLQAGSLAGGQEQLIRGNTISGISEQNDESVDQAREDNPQPVQGSGKDSRGDQEDHGSPTRIQSLVSTLRVGLFASLALASC